jgi:hypothetical protein
LTTISEEVPKGQSRGLKFSRQGSTLFLLFQNQAEDPRMERLTVGAFRSRKRCSGLREDFQALQREV